MSTIVEQGDDLDWKAVIDLLREGKVAEIPCEKERDYIRRRNQVLKRAEKKGISIEVHRGEGLLRIEPLPGVTPIESAQDAAATQFQGERQEQRQQRREAMRVERSEEREPNS